MSFITQLFSKKGKRGKAGENDSNNPAVKKTSDAEDDISPVAEKPFNAEDGQNVVAEKPSDAEDSHNPFPENHSESGDRIVADDGRQPVDDTGSAAVSDKKSAKEAKKAYKKAEIEKKKQKNAAKKEALKKNNLDKAKAKQKATQKQAAIKKKKESKPKLTEEEKIQLKFDKLTAKHDKKLLSFEKKALAKDSKLRTIAEKKENLHEIKVQRRTEAKEQSNLAKQRKKEISQQKKYWRSKGVGRTAHRLGITACIIAMLGFMTSGVVMIYKSDKVNIPVINALAETVINSPLSVAPEIIGPPVKWIASFASSRFESFAAMLKSPPTLSDLYYYELDNDERYTEYQTANADFAPSEVVWRVNAGCDLELYESAAEIKDTGVKPLVINKFNYVSAKYVPPNLVDIPSTQMKADKDALNALTALLEAADANGLKISIASSYRSYEYQSILYNPEVSDKREDMASWMTKPGYSEHQTGEAFDLCTTGQEMQMFPGTPEATWIKANCEEFGFLLRYPRGMEDVTGHLEEPWHLRYVGDTVIKTMQDNEIKTLEEYKVKYIDHKEGEQTETPDESGAEPETKAHTTSKGPI